MPLKPELNPGIFCHCSILVAQSSLQTQIKKDFRKTDRNKSHRFVTIFPTLTGSTWENKALFEKSFESVYHMG